MTDSPATRHYHCPTCGRTYRTADAAARGWACCDQRLQAIPAGVSAQPSAPATRLELCEVLPGRDSETAGRGAENLFASLGADEPYALEIWSEPHGHHLLVRAPSPVLPFVLGPIRAVYPQAGTRPLPCAQPGDPAYRAPGEALVGVELRLEHPAYLPLRTFRDEDYATADPLAGVLGSPLALQPGERLLAQIVLRPAPPDWGQTWAHLAHAERANPFATAPALRTLAGNVRAFLVLLLVVGGGAAFLLGGLQLLAHHYQEGALTLGGSLAAGLPLAWLAHRLGRQPFPDPALVQEKLAGGPAFRAWLRLFALGPDRGRLLPKLHQLAAAYRQVQHGLGNRLAAHDLPDSVAPYDLYTDPLAWSVLGRQARPPWRALPLLTARELAALWHLPHRDVELQLVPRPRYRRLLPPLDQVRDGVLLGHAEHLGRRVAVKLPLADLQQHTLLVGKTQRGKSTLMGGLVDAALQDRQVAVLVLDPHSDLVRGLLRRIPPAHRDRVAYVDLNDQAHPVGINLLDPHGGRGRQQIVDDLISDFSRIWHDYWGPRMSDIFRHALAALVEANEHVPRPFTLLDVNGLVADKKLREYVLQHVHDPRVRWWWDQNQAVSEQNPRWWEEITRPVLDKINLFAVYDVTRHIFGQPRTTLDLPALVAQGQVILVDTAAGLIGQETAALVGTTLLDIVARCLRAQGAAEKRRRALVVVDEFQTLPANYEGFIAELAKFGGHIVLGTQSLRRLDARDPALRQTLLSNVSHLFVFQASAEDAHLLVDELDGAVTVADVVNLPDFACYAKLSRAHERLPAFSMTISEPRGGDEALAQEIAAASARQYGRPRAEVEREIAAMMSACYSEWRPAGDAGPLATGAATRRPHAPLTGRLGY